MAERLGIVIRTDTERDRSVVGLVGDLDLSGASHVRSALPRLAGQELVVDLSRLAFMDAAGLSALLLVRDRLAHSGRCLVFQGARGIVHRVFDLAGLGHLVEEAA